MIESLSIAVHAFVSICITIGIVDNMVIIMIMIN